MRRFFRLALPLAIPIILVTLWVGAPATPADASDPDGPHLPDLQTLPIHPVNDIDFRTIGGVRYLRLDNSVVNAGDGPFELFPINNAQNGTTDAYQRVYTHDGGTPRNWSVYSETLVGTFTFHQAHNHWHFDDFAVYELRAVAEGGGISDTIVASSEKVSFCIINTGFINNAWQLEHYVASVQYNQCGQDAVSGLSVGAYDTYDRMLPDQTININSVPSGQYWLVSTADPSDRVDETDETNNTAAVLIQITQPTPTPTPSPAPTLAPSATPTPTATPAATASGTPTTEPTPTPTSTPGPSGSATQPPTDDPRPTDTPGPTLTSTPTAGATPITTPFPPPIGSTDCDDDVDSVDSLLVLREVAGLPTVITCFDKGDVNCDGHLEALDAQLILRYIAALPIELPEGCPPIGSPG